MKASKRAAAVVVNGWTILGGTLVQAVQAGENAGTGTFILAASQNRQRPVPAFFRFSTRQRIIVYAWVKDSSTLRTYGRRDDAYAVFARMLDSGNPPDDWDALVRGASTEQGRRRLKQFGGG